MRNGGDMVEKLRVGFAGADAISLYHLVAWSQTPDAKLLAICDAVLATQGRDNLPCSFIVPAMTPAIERPNIAEVRMFGTGQVPSDRSVQKLNAARFEPM
jgi:hypothetical protein